LFPLQALYFCWSGFLLFLDIYGQGSLKRKLKDKRTFTKRSPNIIFSTRQATGVTSPPTFHIQKRNMVKVRLHGRFCKANLKTKEVRHIILPIEDVYGTSQGCFKTTLVLP
jgi:hypothetical protein